MVNAITLIKMEMMTMKKVSLKQAIEKFGGVNIELHTNYMEQTGFFEKDGQLYYICSGDVRRRRPDGQLNVMYRTAKHRKDWTGGINQWGFVPALNEMGFSVVNCRFKQNGN